MPAVIDRMLPVVAVLVTLTASADAGSARRQQLFRIARSTNANVVIYDANVDRAGRLVEDAPVVAYWIMLAEDRRRESLTWLENELAYGFEVVGSTAADARLRLHAFQE